MPYGAGTCTWEEQDGWTPEATPGPLAQQAQRIVPLRREKPAARLRASLRAFR
jgi:hypothetical protein